MHKIDSSGATSDSHFTDGDPVAGLVATILDAAFLNAVQDEIVTVIESADITLDKTQTTQLRDAIVAMITLKTPVATTTAAGLARQATDAEVAACTEDGPVFLVPKNLAVLETFRLSQIGVPVPVSSTTCDDSFKLADGSLVLFADYPELEAKYDAGKLLVLGADSTEEQQEALPLYFVAHSGGTGLYLPRLGGLFARVWTGSDDGTAGGYNAAGLPNITGTMPEMNTYGSGQQSASGALYESTYRRAQRAIGDGEAYWQRYFDLSMNAGRCHGIYGNSTTVMPESFNQPYAIYLGQYIGD